MANKIYRSSDNRVLFGVCGGLGEYFNIDPSIIRLFWLLLSFNGIGIFAYIICAFVIPEGDGAIYYDSNNSSNYKNSAIFVGFVLIIIGATILIKKI